MKKQQVIHIVFKAVFSSLILSFNTFSWAQDEAAVELELKGRAALDSGSYEKAIELFSMGALRATDSGLKARLDFRQAVAWQQLSKSETNPEAREELMRKSARLYLQYLEENPASTAAANNLASLYKQIGIYFQENGYTDGAARYFKLSARFFEQAIKAADSRQGLYLKNYAELLELIGEWEKASGVYQQIVREQPMSSELQQSIADSYAKHGLSELSLYLWELLKAGNVQAAVNEALDALQQSTGVDDSGRIEILTVVCAALAEETYKPVNFPQSKTGIRIARLGNDSFLGDGARAITRLHQGLPLTESDYRWWRAQAQRDEDRDLGLWPTEGFQALIRSLGSRAKSAGNIPLADGYFRLSATFLPWETDPTAVRSLVLMYAEINKYDEINGLLEDYQFDLFTSKGAAIAGARDGKIFEYHQTLGELYALIGRWGNSSQPDSAIYQLEHARVKSQVLENSSDTALKEKYQFTPQMVDMLTTGYKTRGETEKISKLRIEQAETYQKKGDIKATKRVLSPLETSTLPDTLEGRYERLITTPAIDLQKVKRLQIKDKEGMK